MSPDPPAMRPVISIGGVPVYGRFGLSPMAGATDAAFRRVCAELGASYTVTEMASAKALCFQDRKTRILLEKFEGEGPFAVQIFGSEPDIMAEGARRALELSGADIVDINMGCPAPKICGNGEGCALMRDMPRAERIIKSVVYAAGRPATVKFRKGWDEKSANGAEFAVMAESSGASALCIHGRTRDMFYSGMADRKYMEKVVSAVKIPVMVNGDITAGEDGARILKETGAAFALIGRGALGNPWIFGQAEAVAKGTVPPPLPDLKGRLEVFLKQVHLAAGQKGETAACREARKHFMWYIKGIRGTSAYKNMATAVKTLRDIEELAGRIVSEGS